MKRWRKLVTAIAGLLLCTPWLLAKEEAPQEGIGLTIYNQNIALVKEIRSVDVKEGTDELRYSDVAAQIDPTSVHIESLTAPEAFQVLEQNFQYDLVSTERLLSKYIDRQIAVVTKDGNLYEGTLLSFDGSSLVIAKDREAGPIFSVSRDKVRDVQFSKLLEGLITKPTLVWLVSSTRALKHLTKLTYLTEGINWKADYVAAVAPDDKSLDLTGWVTIDNQSGATYKDAKLKLIAGEIHRVTPPPVIVERRLMMAEAGEGAPQFVEKAFFEYHMYTLVRPATVRDRETKQIQLLSAAGVSATKTFRYNGARDGAKVRVVMEFENRKESNLGMPLPKGKVRVYKADVDGSLEFLGEDEIDHTPKDEKVKIFIGNAFDIVGERKQTGMEQRGGNVQDLSFEIRLRNHKTEEVEVIVEENFPQWVDWEIIAKSHPFEKKSQELVEFKVKVGPDKEEIITYTVRYRYR